MILQGDALSVLTGLDPESADMCLTSPPYWGLRDYGNEQTFGGDEDCEHEWGNCGKSSQRLRDPKAAFDECLHPSLGNTCLKCNAWKGQLGLEPTPELYIEHMTAVFHEVKRVLKNEGTLWLNIGDTYSGSGKGSGDDGPDPKFKGGGRERTLKPDRNNSLSPKCLCMIPERLCWSLIQDGWILRNKIVWYKPNGMPSSVKDRFTNKWEYLYLLAKNKKYYFDLDAVREEYTEPMNRWGGDNLVAKGESMWDEGTGQETYRDRNMRPNPDGKNPGDVFEIPTQPFPEAHFAVFPEKLCQKPIKAGCPEQVCKKCGKGKERIIELGKISSTGGVRKNRQSLKRHNYENPKMIAREHKTTGWTSCDCNAGFEGGAVLDPFCGAGTVGVVAKELGRNFIGIDIKKEYCDMAEKRIAKVGHQQELTL